MKKNFSRLIVLFCCVSSCSANRHIEPSAEAMEAAYRASAEMDFVRASFQLFRSDLELTQFTKTDCTQSVESAWVGNFPASFTSSELGQTNPEANDFLRKLSDKFRSGTFFRLTDGQWQYQA